MEKGCKNHFPVSTSPRKCQLGHVQCSALAEVVPNKILYSMVCAMVVSLLTFLDLNGEDLDLISDSVTLPGWFWTGV